MDLKTLDEKLQAIADCLPDREGGRKAFQYTRTPDGLSVTVGYAFDEYSHDKRTGAALIHGSVGAGPAPTLVAAIAELADKLVRRFREQCDFARGDLDVAEAALAKIEAAK